MQLHQLEYLAAVVDEANFTRAAARLHVAQPGVSAQIRRLEAELGEELLDRAGGSITLTAAGAAVLPYARAALAAVAGAREAVDELRGLVRGRVAVGVITSTAVDLPGLLAAFHTEHPGVELSLEVGAAADLLERLRAGTVDLALVALAGAAPPDLDVQGLGETSFVAAVGPGDPLARRASVRLTELARRPLACLPHGTALRATLERAAATAGVKLRVAFEADDPGALAELARRGLGVAIVPDSIAALHDGGLHAVRITRPELRGRLVLAWRRGGRASPAARAFIAHARTELPAR